MCTAAGLQDLKRGTLNVEIERDYHSRPDYVIPAAQVNDVHGLHLERCRVRGLRSQNDFGAPRPGWRNNPLNVLELMSEHHLRSELSLEDGAIVEVEVGGDAEWWSGK